MASFESWVISHWFSVISVDRSGVLHSHIPDGYVSAASPSTSTGMCSASTPLVSSMYMNAW